MHHETCTDFSIFSIIFSKHIVQDEPIFVINFIEMRRRYAPAHQP